MKKLSAQCMLLSVSALSWPALVQEQEASFDNFLLSSPSIISPSQHYQVKGGRFEALAGVVSGSFKNKTTNVESDASGQALAAGYAQALSSQLFLGADVRYLSLKNEIGGRDFEDSTTEIRPTVAFALSPLFSLGAAMNITSGKSESLDGDDSYSANTFTVGGTLHQPYWEAKSLVFMPGKAVLNRTDRKRIVF